MLETQSRRSLGSRLKDRAFRTSKFSTLVVGGTAAGALLLLGSALHNSQETSKKPVALKAVKSTTPGTTAAQAPVSHDVAVSDHLCSGAS